MLVGLDVNDNAYVKFSQKHELRLYTKKQFVYQEPEYRKSDRFTVVTTVVCGGDGFVIRLKSVRFQNSDMNNMPDVGRLKVDYVALVIGECEESRCFGRWKGPLPLPDTKLPRKPEDLKKIRIISDDDYEDASYLFERLIGKRRVISYLGVMDDNVNFPYGFVFDKDQISMLILFKRASRTTVTPTAIGQR